MENGRRAILGGLLGTVAAPALAQERRRPADSIPEPWALSFVARAVKDVGDDGLPALATLLFHEGTYSREDGEARCREIASAGIFQEWGGRSYYLTPASILSVYLERL